MIFRSLFTKISDKKKTILKQIYDYDKKKRYKQICSEIMESKNNSTGIPLTQEQRKIIYNLFCRYDYPEGTYKSGQKNHDNYMIDILHPEASYIIVHNIYHVIEEMAKELLDDIQKRKDIYDTSINNQKQAVGVIVDVFNRLFSLGYICQSFEDNTLTQKDCQLIKICSEFCTCNNGINFENVKRMDELKQRYKNDEILSYQELSTIKKYEI